MTIDGAPLAGVTLLLSGAKSGKAMTNSHGLYSFTGLETGNFFTVTPALANFTFSPAVRSFSLIGNRTEATFIAVPDAIATTVPI